VQSNSRTITMLSGLALASAGALANQGGASHSTSAGASMNGALHSGVSRGPGHLTTNPAHDRNRMDDRNRGQHEMEDKNRPQGDVRREDRREDRRDDRRDDRGDNDRGGR